MKIAAHVDENGTPLPLTRKGRVQLYDNDEGAWRLVGEFPFELPGDGSLGPLRASLNALARRLGDWRVLLSGEVRGFAYSYLQDQFGVRPWRSDGALVAQLTAVAAAEEKRAAEACACPSGDSPSSCGGCGGARSTVVPMGGPGVRPVDRLDGSRSFDLIAAMAVDSRLNSRLALMPLLTEAPFRPIEIRLDHRPRWFARDLDELGLTFTEETRDGALFITVTAEGGDTP
ncbi:Fe-only nitrogenase accessory protein AnfO [Cereibacter sphaeroides]|uniref:Fe-only nitrogenase accessory protein AnfO n=1 Tax=Cereibacter sphaeroides TaxID=1063 RepID=UPI000191CCAF|nr:Fe-only nitrogenase accessory protein AnfO [Cereibacter sphaeroides]ACM03748.1 Hypothetical Protein RSKD131_3888 [Cereibacter sphaeroides KD131]